MVFRVFQVADQGAYFVVLILCALSSTGAVALRFLATHRSRRKVGAEDWLSLAAVLLFLARIGLMLDCLMIVDGRKFDSNLDQRSYETVFKMIFAQTLSTMFDQTFSKLSICALYLRMFGISNTYRRWVHLLTAAQCLTCAAFMTIQILLCRPLQDFWTWSDRPNCMPWTTLLLATEPPNSIIDFGLVGLAMVMIRPVQLTSGEKLKLRFLFSLGSLAGFFGFIKIGIAYDPNPHHLTASLGIWGALHSLLGIVCCCAPVYGILQPYRFWDGAVSKISACGQRTKRRGPNPTSQPDPWLDIPLDGHFQGESGSVTKGRYSGSANCLVTSGGRHSAPCSSRNYAIGSIQVDRRVDDDGPRAYEALDEGTDYLPQQSRLSRPDPSHRPPLGLSPDV